MKISIFGTGYVGLVTGSCLANLGHEILCVDIDEAKIQKLLEGKIPFYEPGLKDLVAKNIRKERLKFSTNMEEGVNFADVIFNCVGTPGQDDGTADLKYVYAVAENVGKFAKNKKYLVNKSTVPPGTAKECHIIIQQQNPLSQVEIVSNPEFLAEGKAVYDFTHPDKIVVGSRDSAAYSVLRKVYTGRVRSYIPFLETDWATAETIKYANNSFLATKICFINEIANICDKVGADVKLISQAMGLDYRISPKFLHAGIGYGGSCFPKDVRALYSTAKKHGYDAKLLKEVDDLNKRQHGQMLTRIKEHFNQDLTGKRFTIWGLSFKPKTSDIREAPALTVINQLLEHGAEVHVHDPVAMPEMKEEFGEKITFHENPHNAVEGSSGIIVLTEWDEYRNVHLNEFADKMQHKVVFDGRNIYEPELVQEDGFTHYGVGRR